MPDEEPSLTTPLRLRRTFELLVVFLLTLIPASLSGFVGSDAQGLSFKVHCALFIFRSAQWTALLLYLMWRSGEPWSVFGIQRPTIGDSIKAIAILFAIIVLGVALALAISPFRPELHEEKRVPLEYLNWLPFPKTSIDWLLLLLTCLCIGFSEELLVRCFLLVRLEQLFKSAWAGIVLSSVLFGLGHSYKSFLGALGTGLLSVLYGIAFVRWRRLWPLVLAHAIQDFLALSVYLFLRPTPP
jgi:membrane protease YdiL (CAAX protease family)